MTVDATFLWWLVPVLFFCFAFWKMRSNDQIAEKMVENFLSTQESEVRGGFNNRLLYTYNNVSASSTYNYPTIPKVVDQERCSYCGNKIKEDSRGNCAACGGGLDE